MRFDFPADAFDFMDELLFELIQHVSDDVLSENFGLKAPEKFSLENIAANLSRPSAIIVLCLIDSGNQSLALQ
jgi:hypothetical protein